MIAIIISLVLAVGAGILYSREGNRMHKDIWTITPQDLKETTVEHFINANIRLPM